MRVEVCEAKFEGLPPLLGHRLDRGGHRTLAALNLRVLAKGMDLVAFQFGVLAGGREHDSSPPIVDFISDLKALFHRMPEKLLDHRDYILERVVLIVPQNDVVARLPFGFLFFPGPAFEHSLLDRFGNSGSRFVCHGMLLTRNSVSQLAEFISSHYIAGPPRVRVAELSGDAGGRQNEP
jgi:hypothetical protein